MAVTSQERERANERIDERFLEQLGVAGAHTGILAGLAEDGQPLVNIAGEPDHRSVRARSCVGVHSNDIGRSVVLLFEHGHRDRPIIVGIIQPSTPASTTEVELDGHTVELKAEQSVVLRCGDASISLNRDGKIVIRGKHIVSHAAGVNRLRGGSVQLN